MSRTIHHNNRMKAIFRKRGRIPSKATHEVRHILVKTKSRSGVEYTHYKPMIFKK